MNDLHEVTIEVPVHFTRGAAGRKDLNAGIAPTTPPDEAGRVPRVSRLMALAIRFDDLVRHGYTLWQMLFFLSLVPAVLEEIAFRGIIQRRLQFVLGERETWLVQAALFSVLHLSPVIFLTHFAMGLLFGWLRTRTGSLIPCLILHGAWNAAIVVAELYF